MSKIKFQVLSRKEVESEDLYGTINSSHILISINETDTDMAKIALNNNCINYLRVIFNDIDDKDNEKGIFFDDVRAEGILWFVDKYIDKVKLIVVHCHAGVSRSVAVAAALSKILNNEDDKIFKSGCPNMLVYRTLLDKYFLTSNFHTLWNKIWKIRKSNLPTKLARFTTLYK